MPVIQIATLPHLVVRPPESFALTCPCSVLVHHLALLICKSRARTDRANEPQEKCARNGRLRRLHSRSIRFPVLARKFPVLQNIFPVNSLRELLEKFLRHSPILLGNRLLKR